MPKVLVLGMLTCCAGRQAYKSPSTEQRGGPDGGEVSNMGSWRQKTGTLPWVTWGWLPSSFPLLCETYSILGTRDYSVCAPFTSIVCTP